VPIATILRWTPARDLLVFLDGEDGITCVPRDEIRARVGALGPPIMAWWEEKADGEANASLQHVSSSLAAADLTVPHSSDPAVDGNDGGGMRNVGAGLGGGEEAFGGEALDPFDEWEDEDLDTDEEDLANDASDVRRRVGRALANTRALLRQGTYTADDADAARGQVYASLLEDDVRDEVFEAALGTTKEDFSLMSVEQKGSLLRS
jgi:hypothetical protein